MSRTNSLMSFINKHRDSYNAWKAMNIKVLRSNENPQAKIQYLTSEEWLSFDGFFFDMEDPPTTPSGKRYKLTIKPDCIEFNKDNCYWKSPPEYTIAALEESKEIEQREIERETNQEQELEDGFSWENEMERLAKLQEEIDNKKIDI